MQTELGAGGVRVGQAVGKCVDVGLSIRNRDNKTNPEGLVLAAFYGAFRGAKPVDDI